MRYVKLASLTAATLALGLLASSPSFSQATQPATGGKMAPPPAATTAPKADSKMAPAPKAETKAAPKADLLDINSATADQLKALKGIGDAVKRNVLRRIFPDQARSMFPIGVESFEAGAIPL